MSNEADILSSLDRIESLVDGFLELGKSEDLAKTIGHLSFDGLKTNIHDPQEFGIIAPISEPVAVTRPRQVEIFQRAQLNQPQGHKTPEASKRTIERAKQMAARPFDQDIELSYMGYKNPTKIFGANVNWDERVTPNWKIPQPHERRHFSAVKEGTKMNLVGLKGHETEHSLFDLVARKYGSKFRADLAAHLVNSMPSDSQAIAKLITNRIAGYSPIEDKDFFDEETINVHHNFLMSPEYREYVFKKLAIKDPSAQREIENVVKRGWQHLMRASRQVRPNQIDPSIPVNDVPVPLKPKREETVAKTESLVKMAIADIKPSDTGDYSHLVPEHLRDDYSIHLTEDEDADYDKALVAKIRYRGEHAGTIVGNISGNSITTHQWIKPIHQNKKLGNAGMEAVLAHAFHKFGVTEVAEHLHSIDASRVHASLSRKHGMRYKPDPLDEETMYHEGYVIKSENGKMPSGSDSIVLDIDKAPQQHLTPNFYRITPDVQRAYQMMGRGASVANGQYVSDPSPSVGGGVSLAFDNDKDLHDYVENVYEPHLVKNVLPSIAANKAVLLAPVPIHSLKHGNHSPFLTINHLHGVSVSQDRRGRVPFYYTMAKLASEIGHVHPLLPPAISEYHEAPHQHHIIKMVDGNGRAVSARTAGSTHVLSYVTMKPEHVEPFLKMLHETAPSEDMPVRSILGLPELPNKFSVGDIPKILSHTKKSERRMLNNLDKVESLVDTLIGRR